MEAMISDKPIHHRLWEQEIEKLETFAECIVQFIDCEDEFWRLFDKALGSWRGIFECRIWDQFSPLCDHQVRYFSALNKCLDIKLFRDFVRKLNIFETFLVPIMRCLVGSSFHEQFEDWSGASKMAFAIIYKFHTMDFESELEENLEELTKMCSTSEGIQTIWKTNQAYNDQKLCEIFQIYWQLFCNSNQALVELQIKRSIVDCDDCIPLHDTCCISKLRSDHMAITWTPPDDDDEELLRRMRPFIANICAPPIEEDIHFFVSFIGMQVTMCNENLSRHLLQDRDVVKKWSRLILTYRPDHLSSWSKPLLMLQNSLGLFLGKKKLKWTWLDDSNLDHHWSLVEERVMWFGEAYTELVKENPNWSLIALIREQRYLNIQAVVLFSALLLYNGTLIERDQLEIIDGAVTQYNEIVQSRPSLAEEYRNYLSLLLVCLHREVCVRMMMLVSERKFRKVFFREDIVDYCAFRFLNPETPVRIFQAAIHTVEVSLLFKTNYRGNICKKFGSRLQEISNAGGQNEWIATLELKELKRVEKLRRKKMKRKMKRLRKLCDQTNQSSETEVMTVTT